MKLLNVQSELNIINSHTSILNTVLKPFDPVLLPVELPSVPRGGTPDRGNRESSAKMKKRGKGGNVKEREKRMSGAAGCGNISDSFPLSL